MVVEEFKSDGALIKIDNKCIVTKEEEKEILDTLLSLTINKIQKEGIF